MFLPFPRSYWVIPDRLLAGFLPDSRDAEEGRAYRRALIDCGIRCIINLMEPDEHNHLEEPFIPYEDSIREIAASIGIDVICKRISIRDMDVPNRETMRSILDEIDGALEKGMPTYVHCWGGKGRTGTVIGCWLARHGIAAGEDALRKIEELRRQDSHGHERSPETEVQREMVRGWGRGE